MDSFLGFEKIKKGRKNAKPRFPTERESWLTISAFTVLALVLMSGANSDFNREIAEHSKALSQYRFSRAATVNIPDVAKIELDFGGGKVKRFEGQFGMEKDPLRLALNEIANVSRLPIKINNGQIAEINGVGRKRGAWVIYKNGSKTRNPLDELLIGVGDHYQIKYESR